MKLIQPIELILNVDKIRVEKNSLKSNWDIVQDYAKFLKLPMVASQFVPVDEEGNILYDKEWKQFEGNMNDLEIILEKHKKAKNKVFFKGFEAVELNENGIEVTIKDMDGNLSYIPIKENSYQTIENPILRHSYELSDYAINLIFGEVIK